MKNLKLLKALFVSLLVVGLLFGFAACGDSDDNNNGSATFTQDEVDVWEDLQYVRRVVSENLETFGVVWEQIMLADDVPAPEMKYGLLVVPFFPSDLTRTHTRTVDISGGNFYVRITSAETGIIWTIDQDGNVRRAS